MSTRLKYYIKDLIADADCMGATHVTFELMLDQYGCVDQKGKQKITFTVDISGKSV